MTDRIPQPHDSVNDVMRRWPETIGLFMDHGMACAGCAVGDFHTVEDAALEYRIPLSVFLAELRDAVAATRRRADDRSKMRTANRRRVRRQSQAAEEPGGSA